jgi:hypothetical protein
MPVYLVSKQGEPERVPVEAFDADQAWRQYVALGLAGRNEGAEHVVTLVGADEVQAILNELEEARDVLIQLLYGEPADFDDLVKQAREVVGV